MPLVPIGDWCLSMVRDTDAAIPSTVTSPLTTAHTRQCLTGPSRLITNAVSDALLGSEAIAAHPDQAAEIIPAFTEADPGSIRRTIRFMHRWRPLTDTVSRVTVPTLFLTGGLGDQHWRPADAEAAAATTPNARTVTIPGARHVSPLLVDADLIGRLVVEFWRSLE